ncbi:uncharacterized protein T551_01987 [Pneumocystis jirovecii RU7]|uniref:PUM-HD domain-containing protein n=1 Tax=Pneumocystis jirovecii (strain RU7) TaxID=1408657 RepID=A0A0W4ZNV4_PNEJ7|nr:uncharacterized protein T551_01987 [Pneumocystis jirovecii RU7]KTW30043.1 hypothetical protein T551_01987 [Pneumocystis jirovecii RU7]
MKTFVEADNMREKQEDMLTGGIMSGQSGWRAKKAELMNEAEPNTNTPPMKEKTCGDSLSDEERITQQLREIKLKMEHPSQEADQTKKNVLSKDKDITLKLVHMGNSNPSIHDHTRSISTSTDTSSMISPLTPVEFASSYVAFAESAEIARLKAELKASQRQVQHLEGEVAQSRIAAHTINQAINLANSDDNQHKLDSSQFNDFSRYSQTTSPQMGSCWSASYGDDSVVDFESEENLGSVFPRRNNSSTWNFIPRSNSPLKNTTTISSNEIQTTTRSSPISVQNSSEIGLIRPWKMHRASTSISGPPVSSGFNHFTLAGRRASTDSGYASFSSFGSLSNQPPSPAMSAVSTGSSSGIPRLPMTVPSTFNPLQISNDHQGNILPGNVPINQHIWNSNASISQSTPGCIQSQEPINYRRLLDRNAAYNWQIIVDRIVYYNDQQASIFLQQKLKLAPAEQKYAIIDAIVAQAYPLMLNRFGNFLVQRCFEHGTQEHIDGIASAIRGNVLTLSMDAFGCHVVQKAFDNVAEDVKATMVSELLRRIPETVTHRYACHVWQKLFEIRWEGSPPAIMKYVNAALEGMWHDVALGETGSLVVQNIFENCLEEDKRPCIEEVLSKIDIISRGQWGNWVIQHMVEYGSPADKERALSHILENAVAYSVDQFASKVVEKAIKAGGPDILNQYLARVTEGRPDRPRIPLIDIASDQYGNYLIQHILQHASPAHRDQVSAQIRKHMVSLRGSKYGQKVAFQVERWRSHHHHSSYHGTYNSY